MNRMILANLVHRPIRAIISIFAVAVEVTLILLIVGIMLGMLNDSSSRQAGVGADILVQPPGASLFMGISGAPVSAKVADKIRQLPHVTAVAPVVAQLSTAGNVQVIDGIDLQSFEAVGGPLPYLSGGPFQGPYSMIIDDLEAGSKHHKVGDKVEVLNHEFTVTGIVEHGRGARQFVPLQTLQDVVGAQGKASIFYVKLDTPNNADLVVQEIKDIPGMAQYGVHSVKEYLSLMTSSGVPGLNTVIRVVIGIAMIIGFIVIFQAMYAAVMERTREIGILKSLGAGKFYIVGAILRETMLIAIGGVILGIAISYAARSALKAHFQTLPLMITNAWLLRATIIAIIGSLLGALYPALKAAQKDPIDALAYE
jgi:putative ABC transport system permease protein